MKIAMPVEFRQLGQLSEEYRAERVGEDFVARFEREIAEGPPPLYIALSHFTDEQLAELIGWMWLGRDYDPSEGNPSHQLSGFIANAVVNPRDEAIVYVMQKPLKEYLAKAEKIMVSAD